MNQNKDRRFLLRRIARLLAAADLRELHILLSFASALIRKEVAA